MAFGLFRKRGLEPVAPAIQQPRRSGPAPEADSTRKILELLELELGGQHRDGEIDVPIRVRRRHWGGFHTAYKL